jgi:DivIVA domain-containing protein
MTPEDIKSQRFGMRLLRGLRPEEVSAFLEDVAEAYGDVQKWNVELMDRVEGLQKQMQEASASTHIETLRTATLREVEALVHDAQSRAQTLIDGAKESEAAILREAEAAKARMQLEAEESVARVREQEATLRSEIARLDESRLQLVDDLRAALDTYQQWLATVDPRGRARGRREALETSNGGDESVRTSDELKAG